MTAVVAAFTVLAVAVAVVVIWAVVLLIKDDFDDTQPVVVAGAQRRSSNPRTEPSRSAAQQRRTGTRPKDGEAIAASARDAADAVHAERPGAATSVTQRLRALPLMTRLIAAGGAAITVIVLAVFAVSASTGGASDEADDPQREVASGPAETEGSSAPVEVHERRDAMFADTLEQHYGISMDTDTAVDIAQVACESPTAGVGFYNAAQRLQQRYPDYSPNTISRVMAAGLLAYCPERLP